MTERIIDAIISSTPVLGLIGVTGVICLVFRKQIVAWFKVKAANDQYEKMHTESINARHGVESELVRVGDRLEIIGRDMAVFQKLHDRNDTAHAKIFEGQESHNGRIGKLEGHVEALRGR